MPLVEETLPSQQLNFLMAGLVALLAGVLVLAISGAGRAVGEDESRRRAWVLGAAACVALWLLGTAVLARSGWLGDLEARPPRLLLVMLPTALATVALALGPLGTRFLAGLPVWALVGYQAFRIPVELLLWKAHGEGVLPVQMTFAGLNWDILSGALAIPVAFLASRDALPRAVLAAWNAVGIVLLGLIVTVAILSLPYPFRAFANDPPNTVVFHSPWVWLPTFLVPSALFGHVVVLRLLLCGKPRVA